MDGSPWGALDPRADQPLTWQIGRCRVWARSTEDEWEIGYRHEPSDGPIPTVPEDGDLEWTRYVTVANDQPVMVPVLPDRPVVVRPASPIVILPGRWGRFFFRVPLWIRFASRHDGRDAMIDEIPSRRLTSTWFGNLAGGELCYAIEAPLERRFEELVIDDSFAACEVSVRNASRERLRFERICVHVEFMRLFHAGGRLWTNEVKVAFRGADQISQLSFSAGPPARLGPATHVSDPRVSPETGILKRSFALIREIAGI